MKLGNIYYVNKTIENLKENSAMKQENSLEKRKRIDILIIDDEDLTIESSLIKNNFSLFHRTDIDNIRDIAPYSIVLCDIRGVGKALGSEYEGAFIIKEAKLAYPNKQVIAYTASQYDPTFNSFLSYADDIVVKGTGIDEWIAILDKHIEIVTDPYLQWSQLRKALLDQGVSTIQVADLEQKYVIAIKTGNFNSLKKIAESNKGYLKSAITEFLSSAVVKFIASGGL